MSSQSDAVWWKLAELSSYHLQTGWLLARWLGHHPVRGAVLDVGCGTMPFRGLFGEQANCYGVDMAPAVGVAAPLVIGQMERLPFCDGVFSAVLSSFSLHQGREHGQLLREMRRVLAEDGTLFLAVPSRAYLVYRLPSGLRPKNLVVHEAFTQSELVGLLEDAGFKIASIDGCAGVLSQVYENALGWVRRWGGAKVRPGGVPRGPVRPASSNRSLAARLRRITAATERFTGAWRLGYGIWFIVAVRRDDR